MGGNNKIDNDQSILQQVGNNVASNFEGIFSIKPIAKYLSGARCILRVNGKIVGFAFSVSWKISTEATEIVTIDDYLPYELAPSRISVSGSIGAFRIPGSGPGKLLMQSDTLSFLHQRYIEIEVRDEQSDTLIFLTKKAMITDRSESIRAESLAEMTLNFKAIGYVDERTPQYPSDVDKSPLSTTGVGPIKRAADKVKDLFK